MPHEPPIEDPPPDELPKPEPVPPKEPPWAPTPGGPDANPIDPRVF